MAFTILIGSSFAKPSRNPKSLVPQLRKETYTGRPKERKRLKLAFKLRSKESSSSCGNQKMNQLLSFWEARWALPTAYSPFRISDHPFFPATQNAGHKDASILLGHLIKNGRKRRRKKTAGHLPGGSGVSKCRVMSHGAHHVQQPPRRQLPQQPERRLPGALLLTGRHGAVEASNAKHGATRSAVSRAGLWKELPYSPGYVVVAVCCFLLSGKRQMDQGKWTNMAPLAYGAGDGRLSRAPGLNSPF